MLKNDDEWDYVPIGAPFHSNIASERDDKPKNDDRDYVSIGAPFHDDQDDDDWNYVPIGAPFHDD